MCSVNHSPDILEGMRLLLKLMVPYFIFTLAADASLKDMEKLNGALAFVLLLHFPFVIETLLKWFGTLDLQRDIPRVQALSGGRVIFGTFMCLIFVLFYYKWKRMPRSGSRAMLVFSILAAVGVILSGTRIAWFALLIAFIALGGLKKARSIAVFSLIALMLILAFLPVLQQRTGISVADGRISFTGIGAGTAVHRFSVWTWLWEEKISRRIITGYGLGSTLGIVGPLGMDYPHNEYIRVTLELGLIGLVLFCVSFVYLSGYLFRKHRKTLILLPIAVFLIMCLADNTLSNYLENGAIFAFLLVYMEKTMADIDLSDA